MKKGYRGTEWVDRGLGASRHRRALSDQGETDLTAHLDAARGWLMVMNRREGVAGGGSTGFHRESLSGPLGAEGDWAVVAAGWAGLTGKEVSPVASIAPLLPPQRFSFLSSSSHLSHVFHMWSK